MFGGCMFCLMWSISPYHPTYNDRVMPPGKYNPRLTSTITPPSLLSSLCLAVLLFPASTWVSAQLTVSGFPLAGMTMAPHLEGHEIAFNASDRKSWRKYARSMEEYLKRESSQMWLWGMMLKLGGLMRMLNLLKILILIFLHLCPIFFPHSFPAGDAGKGSLFVGRG